MNKCKHCGHESDSDVTNVVTNNKDFITGQTGIVNHWYCIQCKKSWFVREEIRDEATSFDFGFPRRSHG